MIETNNWLVSLFIVDFAGAAAAVTVLLSILYLVLSLREWMTR
jgi:hypothetical protein